MKGVGSKMKIVKNEGRYKMAKSKYVWIANFKVNGKKRECYAEPSLEALVGYFINKIKLR